MKYPILISLVICQEASLSDEISYFQKFSDMQLLNELRLSIMDSWGLN